MSELDDYDVVERFLVVVEQYYTNVKRDFVEYAANPSKEKKDALSQKYPHFNRTRITKRTKPDSTKAYIYEILTRTECNDMFDEDERKIIYSYCIKKIKGIYKHAQAWKTGYCNLLILNGLSEDRTISVCITKNTLEANEQWMQRLFKELDHRFPHVKPTDKILIISSVRNNLNGNATHCKDLGAAWKVLKSPDNAVRIIFLCSNKVRVSDVLEIAKDFQNLRGELQRDLRILHDEAHNPKDGVPAYRDIIENILLQPNVLSYSPITASNNSIFHHANPVWKKQNLEKQAMDYTQYDRTKSNDPRYSSCSKSKQIRFEELKETEKWREFGVKKIPKHNFLRVYGEVYDNLAKYSLDKLKETLDKELDLYEKQEIECDEIVVADIHTQKMEYSQQEFIDCIVAVNMERRRTLEFCQFQKSDREMEAVNNGLNVLHMNEVVGWEYYQPNTFNMHIISTPNRKCVSDYLCSEAIQIIPRAVVLGIYGNEGNKYHLHFAEMDCMEVTDVMGDGEFNVKLDRLIKHLAENGIDMQRPFIIIGNYIPTGESLTFVNCSYGTVFGNVRLISTNAEENYQEACRSNYMTTRFIAENPDWVMPDKYLVGPSRFIDDALSYEAENDARIDMFMSNPDYDDDTIQIDNENLRGTTSDPNGTVAIPVKIRIDRDTPTGHELVEILQHARRTDEQKRRFLELIEIGIKNYAIDEIIDKSKKFVGQIDKFTLKSIRCYKKNESGSNIESYRFDSYKTNYSLETPLINETGKRRAFECEILTCMDNYIVTNEAGEVLEDQSNRRNVWWLGYKY